MRYRIAQTLPYTALPTGEANSNQQRLAHVLRMGQPYLRFPRSNRNRSILRLPKASERSITGKFAGIDLDDCDVSNKPYRVHPRHVEKELRRHRWISALRLHSLISSSCINRCLGATLPLIVSTDG